jgi:phenylacetic acid degradation operon negative regulatory protein
MTRSRTPTTSRPTAVRRRAARRRSALDHALDHLRAEPSRTWSLIITLYGDAIVPRGGEVWLGTVLQFCRHLGIDEGVVRTAMSRLAADGWLERRRAGRHSFYGLATRGRETFRDASARIYHPAPPAWAGHFDLVLTDRAADRERVRTGMGEAGFGPLAPDIWVAPGGHRAPRVPGRVLTLDLAGDEDTARALAARVWPLEQLAASYQRFLAAFRPVGAALSGGRRLSDADQLAARVLLVHEFRRVVLRDPLLPAAILPPAWPGADARQLCAAIYARVREGSERWLDAHGRVAPEAPLPAARGLEARFAS